MGFTAEIKNIIKRGFRISIGGKAFDPTYQKRTCPVGDIVKSKSKKEGDKWSDFSKKF